MRRALLFALTLAAFWGISPAAGELPAIAPVEAAHLAERLIYEKLDRRRAFVIDVEEAEVAGRPGYRILCRSGQDGFVAQVDAVAARVLSVKRNGEPFYAWPGPIVVGHRGNVRFAPENTLPAFDAAIRYGADLVEIDIRQTKDGHLVVVHDETLDRTTDGSGPVADRTLAELRQLDAGSWFGPEFKGTRIPTLKEALDHLSGRALPDLDFKAGDPDKLIQAVSQAGLLGKVTLYTGDWDLLERLMQKTDRLIWRPTVKRGKIGLPLLIDRFDPPVVNVNWIQFSESLIREIHLAGKKSFLNTMQHDTEWAIRKALDTMPDYIQTDRIELLMPLLRSRGWSRAALKP